MNAVESLLIRLGLNDYTKAFKERGITSSKMLRDLPDEEIEAIFPNEQDRMKFRLAMRGDVPVPYSDPPPRREEPPSQWEMPAHLQQQAQYGKGRGKGGRHREDRGMFDDFGGGGGGGGKGGYGGHGKGGRHHGGDDRGFRGASAPVDRDIIDDPALQEEAVADLTVKVPAYTVKFLLADNAKKLHDINLRYGTQNSRINKRKEVANPSDVVSFSLLGKPEAVEAAKREIEHFVGIEKRNEIESRFQEMLLGRTKMATSLLYALNLRRINEKDERALHPDTIPEFVSQYLFCNPYDHIQQYYIEVTDKAKQKMDLLGQILYAMPTVQCVAFCRNGKYIETLKGKLKDEQLSGMKPLFLYPPTTQVKGDDMKQKLRKEREDTLATFREGWGPVDKLKVEKNKDRDDPEMYKVVETHKDGFETNRNRLMITTDDYARMARKEAIPYVSLVVNLDIPATKEVYLHRIGCCGRPHGQSTGVAITFIPKGNMDIIYELSRFGLQITELPSNFADALETNLSTDMMSI